MYQKCFCWLIFSIFIFFTSSIYFGDKKNLEIFGNKKLISLSSLPDNYEEIFKYIDNFVNDHLSAQIYLIKLRAIIVNSIFDISPSSLVIKGYNGFYYSAGPPLLQRSNLEYPKGILQNWIDDLNFFDQQTSHLKMRKIILYVPEKSEIYFENLPSKYKRRKKTLTRTDKFLNAIRDNTNFEVIDLREILLKYHHQFPLYYKLDLHWNDIGAYLAHEALRAKINESEVFIDEEYIKQRVSIGGEKKGNLSQQMGLAGYLTEKKVQMKIAPSFNVKEFKTSGLGNIHFNINSRKPIVLNNKNEKLDIMLYHDSFGKMLKKFMGNSYSKVVMINPYHTEIRKEWNDCYLNSKIVSQEKPNIFVFQLLGRRIFYLNENCNKLIADPL